MSSKTILVQEEERGGEINRHNGPGAPPATEATENVAKGPLWRPRTVSTPQSQNCDAEPRPPTTNTQWDHKARYKGHERSQIPTRYLQDMDRREVQGDREPHSVPKELADIRGVFDNFLLEQIKTR